MSSRKRPRVSFTVCLFGVLVLATTGFGQTVPPPFTVDTVIGTGLAGPMDFAFLPDGRVLIAEIDGDLKLLVQQSVASVGTIPAVEVDALPERGVQSFCLDPAFATNGYLYVWYCHSGSAFMRLDRFTMQGDRTNPTSTNLSLGAQRILLDDIPDNSISHNGGTLRFGPDGWLYLSNGDDEQYCFSQDRSSLLGKLLRLDVSQIPSGGGGGAVSKGLLAPPNTPWSSSTNQNERLLLAYGLRNPFGMTIDSLTGDLYLADVGHDNVEEVDRYPHPGAAGPFTGLNYGCPWPEGPTPTVAPLPPQPSAGC